MTPNHTGSALDIEISLAVASILDLNVTDGTDAYAQALNEGNALAASTRYRFSVMAPKFSSAGGSTALTYSLQVRTDGIIQDVVIDEIRYHIG